MEDRPGVLHVGLYFALAKIAYQRYQGIIKVDFFAGRNYLVGFLRPGEMYG